MDNREDIQTQFKLADTFLHAGDILSAEEIYQKLVESVPSHVTRGYLGLALCARRRGARQESLAFFKKLTAMEPGNGRWLPSVADDLRALNQLAEAAAVYREALNILPLHDQAHIGLAFCLRGLGDLPAALAAAREAVRLNPCETYETELIRCLLACGEMEEVASHYRERLKESPDNTAALAGLAVYLRNKGDRNGASEYSNRAAQLAPQNIRYQIEAASDMRALGRLDEEAVLLQLALTQEPHNPAALRAMVSLTRLQKGPLSALTYAQKIKAEAPETSWLCFELAEDLRALGRLEEAEEEYRSVLEKDKESLTALLGLGYCARLRGNREEALRRFQEAALKNPGQLGPQIEIAQEQREIGNIEEAVGTARASVQRHQHNWRAYLSLAHAERAAHRHEAALEAITQALTLQLDNVNLLVERAFTEKALGKLDESAASLKAALTITPSHPTALARMAEFHLASGDNETPLELYRRAVKVQPRDLTLQAGLADALNAQGRALEALPILEKFEAQMGPTPRLRAKRIALLRQTGHYFEALALARAAVGEMPNHFQIALERVHCELLVGDNTAILTSIAAMNPGSTKERAWRCRCLGAAAESTFQYDTAARFYEEAVALAPEDTGIRNALVRVKMLTFELIDARHHLSAATIIDAPNRRLRGKSLNISQTHFGQMLDEYRIDSQVQVRIYELRNIPPAARAAALLGLVSGNPGHTGAAVALMLAMRQANRMETRLSSVDQRIPPQIFQFWDTTPPQDVQAMMLSWRDLNPDHRTIFYNDETAKTYLAEAHPGSVASAYAKLREGAHKADLLRLALLAKEGGIYADADDRCLRALDQLVPPGAELVLHQEDLGTLGNNFIAAVPGHPVIQAALREAVTAIHRGDSDILWLSTGPGLITRCVATAIAEKGEGAVLPENWVIPHRREILQSVAMHCFVGYKRTNSHWLQGSFKSNTEPKSKAG